MQNILPFKKNDEDMKVMMVEVRKIGVPSYQRPVDKKRVKRMCDQYDEVLMEPIKASYRDGRYWCMDGQHRLEMYKMLGKSEIPALVYDRMTYAQECIAYARQQENVARISVAQEWHARCEGEDRAVQNIVFLCRKYGFEIGGKGHSGKKTIGALREIQKIYAKHGSRGLEDVLNVLDGAFQGAHGAGHRDIVAGLGRIIDTYHGLGDYEFNRLISTLGKISPKYLLRESNTDRGRGATAVARVIAKRYNSGLRGDSKKRWNIDLLK